MTLGYCDRLPFGPGGVNSMSRLRAAHTLQTEALGATFRKFVVRICTPSIYVCVEVKGSIFFY